MSPDALLGELAAQVGSAQPEQRAGALLRAFHLSLGLALAPGLLFGGLYLLTRPATLPLPTSLMLTGLGLILALLAFRLARHTAASDLPAPARRLTAALQLASAPAIPALLGLAFLHDPRVLIGGGLVALLAYAQARAALRRLAEA